MRKSGRFLRTGAATVATLFLCLVAVDALAQGTTLRVAFGDVPSVETLNFLIALEHAKARGVDVEVTYFKSEDIANQAVVNRQADIGVGTPYTVIQKVAAPIRIFFQLSTLQFFPIVAKQHYQSWQDLDGEEIVVHSRTSGTLALAMLMAQKEGIKYKNVSYVPGSEVRALAMLQGNIRATYLDAVNTRFLMRKAPNQFLILPAGEVTASDEALFAHQEFMEANPEVMDILVEEFLKVWRRVNADPFYIVEERKRLGLLPDLPEELEPEVVPYFTLGAEGGMFSPDGGGAKAAEADFEFFTVAGQLEGSPADLRIEDFWYLAPLNEALAKLGTVQINYRAP